MMPKVWSIFMATRYKEGVMQESIDCRYSSGNIPLMVPIEDYVDLSRERDELKSKLEMIERRAPTFNERYPDD